MHGQDTGIENVDTVNLFGCNNAHRPGNGIALHLFAQGIAPLFAELLGIVEFGILVVGGQNNGGSKHTSRQTATAGLVTSGFHLIYIIVLRKHGTSLNVNVCYQIVF